MAINCEIFTFFWYSAIGHLGRIFGTEYSADFDRIFGRIFGIRSFTKFNTFFSRQIVLVYDRIPNIRPNIRQKSAEYSVPNIRPRWPIGRYRKTAIFCYRRIGKLGRIFGTEYSAEYSVFGRTLQIDNIDTPKGIVRTDDNGR